VEILRAVHILPSRIRVTPMDNRKNHGKSAISMAFFEKITKNMASKYNVFFIAMHT